MQTTEIPLENLTLLDVIPSDAEYATIRSDCVRLVGQVIKKFVPRLGYLAESIPQYLPVERHFKDATTVVPLPVLPVHEQYVKQMVIVLEQYQDIAEGNAEKMGHPEKDHQFQMGGDQLTRERMTGEKKLRIGNVDPRDRFSLLGTVTFEFFQLGMNYIEKVIFNSLWNKCVLAMAGE